MNWLLLSGRRIWVLLRVLRWKWEILEMRRMCCCSHRMEQRGGAIPCVDLWTAGEDVRYLLLLCIRRDQGRKLLTCL